MAYPLLSINFLIILAGGKNGSPVSIDPRSVTAVNAHTIDIGCSTVHEMRSEKTKVGEQFKFSRKKTAPANKGADLFKLRV